MSIHTDTTNKSFLQYIYCNKYKFDIVYHSKLSGNLNYIMRSCDISIAKPLDTPQSLTKPWIDNSH